MLKKRVVSSYWRVISRVIIFDIQQDLADSCNVLYLPITNRVLETSAIIIVKKGSTYDEVFSKTKRFLEKLYVKTYLFLKTEKIVT